MHLRDCTRAASTSPAGGRQGKRRLYTLSPDGVRSSRSPEPTPPLTRRRKEGTMLARLTLLFSIIVIAFPARAQWQPNGVPLNGGGTPQLATDGSGGALVTWGYWDPWTGQWNYAMAQGVSAAGNTRWQPGGKILCQPSDNFGPQVVSDGNGGAIFVFLDNRSGYVDIYAQRIDWSGAEL